MTPHYPSGRHHLLPLALLLSCAFSSVWAQAQEFDCHVTLGDLKYDLTSLNHDYILSRDRDTPPTKTRDTVRFNLCADLKPLDGVAAEDQCPNGSRACLTKSNIKGNEAAGGRVTHVIPLGNSSTDSITLSSIPSPGKGLQIQFQGPAYPSSTSSEPIPQSMSVSLKCSTEAATPQFVSYDGKEVIIDWSSPAGCSFSEPGGGSGGGKPSEDTEEGDSPAPEKVGSGVGYFFLLLFLAFVAYFGLGAYYNYSTYGASGTDLIPHRDFWREVPYMLRDVLSHLCSAVRPRHSSNRGGYIAV
ncbi:hypothetical protein EIP91_003090 [Steccherinum ochraceum]|uniref:Autophagy-related protein 27 n=1 Tax=Steccherinum ochraceum TaxID=92696 RepID=A0A4R0RDI0_9APHY|nr:hypothetical protein EIP91_003090 [Steccherinum ochraceum]